MNTTIRIFLVLLGVAVAGAGCSKKEGAASKSGLAWEPVGLEKLSATCHKALACCEEMAKSEGAVSASDYNGKCSGPALWKDDDCTTDLKARVGSLQGEGKPVPDACK